MLTSAQQMQMADAKSFIGEWNERRAAPRVRAPAGIGMQTDGTRADVVDLSPVGAQVTCWERLSPNALVRLVLRHGDTATRLSGVVSWCAVELVGERPRYRAGIQFSEPAPVLESWLDDSSDTTIAARKLWLVAEDDGPIRDLMVRALEKQGFTVLQAANGAEALALLADQSRPVDLVISDLEMPVVDGLGLRNRLLRQQCSSKVLLMSGQVNLTSTPICGQTRPFLVKPFTPQVLFEKVREVLDVS